MNELQIFENPTFGSVRSMMIEDEPWFVGKDVATALGYKDTVSAVADHVDDEDKLTWQIALSGQNRLMIIINESGLYSLIFSSKLESARQFKRWVTSEVLPSLRKTGSYSVGGELTKDDYMRAAQAISACGVKQLPYLLHTLQVMGFDLPDLNGVKKHKIKKYLYRDDIDLVELLNEYSLPQLVDILGLPKSSLQYYRSGQYKPSEERRRYIIDTLIQ